MHVLYVEGSPRKQRSASRQVALSFLDTWRALDPTGTIDTLDPWAIDLPSFDGDMLEAKYAGIAGIPRTLAQQQAWTQSELLANRFLAADLVVIGTPMWNFGIPYRLKHLIDLISHKDMLFAFDGREVTGLLDGRTAVIVAARGSNFGEDFLAEEHDFQVRYLQTWLHMI